MGQWYFVGGKVFHNWSVIVSTLAMKYGQRSQSLAIPCLKRIHLSLYTTACFVLLITTVAQAKVTNPFGLVRYSRMEDHRPQGLIWQGKRKNQHPFWSNRKVPVATSMTIWGQFLVAPWSYRVFGRVKLPPWKPKSESRHFRSCEDGGTY